MKLKDFMKGCKSDIDLFNDVVDEEGPTLVLDGFELTPAGRKKYERVLNSEVVKFHDTNYGSIVVVIKCPWKYINEFLWAAAGYIESSEYDKLFVLE